ncbi:MAG: tyrosine-type recombinase/integrase [Rudaea sp.]
MATHKLTKRFIDAIKIAGEEQTVFDEELPGFYLRVSKVGVKSYGIKYRTRSGQQKRLTLGRHGTVTLDQARALARKELAGVAEGHDPQGAKQAYRKAWTIAELAAHFRTHYFPRLRERTRRDYGIHIDRFIAPMIGRKKIAETTRTDIIRLHREVSRLGPTQGNHVFRTLSSMFSEAMREGLLDANPCTKVKQNQENRRERYLSAEEAGRLLIACDEHPNQNVANFVRLLTLTGARKGETLAATWDMFDLENGIWTKPSHHTKQKRTHRVPLAPAAIALLTTMQDDATPGCKWLFPGRDPERPLQETKRPWAQLITAAGITDATLHTLRHSFASVLASSGNQSQVIGKMLGHTQAATTARYMHLADAPLRDAAASFDSIVAAGKAKALEKHKADAAKVVSIASARRGSQ